MSIKLFKTYQKFIIDNLLLISKIIISYVDDDTIKEKKKLSKYKC